MLATILAAVLLAAGLAVAVGSYAYNYVLSLQRGTLVSDERPATDPTLPRPGSPERLSVQRDARAFAVPASASKSATPNVVCTVTITGAPAALVGEKAGLASYSGRTGASLVWVPLSSGERHEDDSVTVTIPARTDGAVLALSTSRETARHGYLASRTLTAAEAAARAVAFDVGAAKTTLRLPDGIPNAGPLQLVRLGNPEWRPRAAARAGVYLTTATKTFLLGAGDYELKDPIDPTVSQRFAVPATAAITIESRLARPRGRLP